MVITSVVTEAPATLRLAPQKQHHIPPHADTTTGRAVPIAQPEGSGVDFGAEIYGIDLNNFTDADFDFISDALHKHKLLVFKEQPQMLTPHFDLEETTGGFAHGHDPFLVHHNGVDFHGIPKRPAIPVQPQVHILGRGSLPEGHFGFPPGFEVQGIDDEELHLPPHIPAEERGAGASRFYQWHFDGSLYNIPPPRVGCLLAEDEAGTEMKMALGATAMVAGTPHAFVWMSTAHSTRLGHLIETEGLEKPLDNLPKWEKSKVCMYPMVWSNPKTGEKSLQVHGQWAYKLYLKNSPDGKERVVQDLKDVIMRPVLQSENIYAHPHQEQDVVLWYNRALWHSILSRITLRNV
ncbi:Clavaminate synthase-like protein [Setomelanomma holmii]|uniref:Clavaminate synthase-like protein n=1 Tax=Setomelanomma holmii TaxID=210430 RepID=A0A9P4H1Q4_9PLEO|nr:Clavaminate synthase-like protein [Setomelanomma holmii]